MRNRFRYFFQDSQSLRGGLLNNKKWPQESRTKAQPYDKTEIVPMLNKYSTVENYLSRLEKIVSVFVYLALMKIRPFLFFMHVKIVNDSLWTRVDLHWLSIKTYRTIVINNYHHRVQPSHICCMVNKTDDMFSSYNSKTSQNEKNGWLSTPSIQNITTYIGILCAFFFLGNCSHLVIMEMSFKYSKYDAVPFKQTAPHMT